ncbi:hypothetical protein [Caballeronia hypogeia]|uniref:hypothetical protein n=1 Tax=Caballeronia hypogeia TaxID=1777140 RepID=UPI0012FD33C3|nr:hypothetical protein [Caballeronia hypogeia]
MTMDAMTIETRSVLANAIEPFMAISIVVTVLDRRPNIWAVLEQARIAKTTSIPAGSCKVVGLLFIILDNYAWNTRMWLF